MTAGNDAMNSVLSRIYALIGVAFVFGCCILINVFHNFPRIERTHLKTRSNVEISNRSLRDITNNSYPLTTNTNSATVAEETKFPPAELFLDEWKDQLAYKLLCRRNFSQVGYYLYHTRKAGGTTLQALLKLSSVRNRLQYHQTEGITLDKSILENKLLLTITHLRDPISRIVSLYWFQHVNYHVTLIKNTTGLRTFADWLNGWNDRAAYKRQLIQQHPNNVFMEVENYYLKAFIGWQYTDGPVNRSHLAIAKRRLAHFDLILITEWFTHPEQQMMLNTLAPLDFQGWWSVRDYYQPHERVYFEALAREIPYRERLQHRHNEGNSTLKQFYTSRLMEKQEETLKVLHEWNALDIELYHYALELAKTRMQRVQEVMTLSSTAMFEKTYLPRCIQDTSRNGEKERLMGLKNQFGVFSLKEGQNGP